MINSQASYRQHLKLDIYWFVNDFSKKLKHYTSST